MNSYTVVERDGCKLVDGVMSLDAFLAIAKGLPKDSVLDAHAARVLGVTHAMGLPRDLEALCAKPDVVEAALCRARALGSGLSEEAIRWMAIGRQGRSSQTLFQRLTGRRLTFDEGHPTDPADFGRCRQLLEEVPELAGRLGEMSSASDVWARLVDQWASLCGEMDAEAPRWREEGGRAPRTLERMKRLGC